MMLKPSFDVNFRKLSAYKNSDHDLPHDWQRTLGACTRKYFEGLASYMQEVEFQDDDFLPEIFRRAVFNGEISVRVVDELEGEGCDFDECVIEDGVLHMQTLPQYWGTGYGDVARRSCNIL